MEYFRIVELKVTEKDLKEKLRLQKLEDFCISIFPLDAGFENSPRRIRIILDKKALKPDREVWNR